MHPIIERDMARARVADPDRQAERQPMARAASLTPHTRREKRKHGRAPARTAGLTRRVLTGLRAHIPPSTMSGIPPSTISGAGYLRWPGRRRGVVMRRLGVRARWWTAVAAALMVIAIPLALAPAAGAAPVPPGDFTCGVTVFTACNQTAHFDTPSGTSAPVVGEPNPQAIGCPAFVAVDAPVIQGTGNGIEHAIVNNNGDGWFTSTFTGTVTVVSWTVDSAGNLVAPDPSVPIFTGHLQFWFGGSFNNKNFVNHDTINFTGTAADGSTFGIHEVDHLSTSAVVTAAPNSFSITHC
jgi:hypothetical protein